MNVLYSYHTSLSYMRPLAVSDRQVICGPLVETKENEHGFETIQTPRNRHDIAQVLNRLPASQKPDLFIAKVDATRINFPCNLDALDCPKILICGDMQHMDAPIGTVLAYARSEPYDVVVADHCRRHLHYFAEMGFDDTFWLPGMNINWHKQPLGLPYENELAFVGQAGRFHPYRVFLLKLLAQKGAPLKAVEAPQAKAVEIYSKSQINFNCSLNGDVNLRVFEVMSAGGFLLSDAVRPETGIDILFDVGRDLDVYATPRELLEKIGYYLGKPEETRAIARSGHKKFLADHTPDRKRSDLLDIVDGKGDERWRVGPVRISIPMPPATERRKLHNIAIYEMAQELQKSSLAPRAIAVGDIDRRVLKDLSNLSRFSLALLPDRACDTLDALVGDLPDDFVRPIGPAGQDGRFASEILLLGPTAIENGLAAVLSRTDAQNVVFDLPEGMADEDAKAGLIELMGEHGFAPLGAAATVFRPKQAAAA